jgi:MscS family membrane protein
MLALLVAAAALGPSAAQPAAGEERPAVGENVAGRGVLDALQREFPPVLVEVEFLDLALWQWIGLGVALLVALVVGRLVTSVSLFLLARGLRRRSWLLPEDRFLDLARAPLWLFWTVVVFHFLWLPLGLDAPAFAIIAGLELVLGLVAFAWFAFRVVDLIDRVLTQRLAERGQRRMLSILPMGRKALKIFVFLVVALALFQNLGFNVTGIIAGLGIGGLAIALAAQKTVENLFGGVTVIADQPIRVGEFCRFGDKIGTVEQIGLRSTRVRTLDRTVVTVPNSAFAEMQIESFAVRDRIRLYAILNLRYETTPDQLRWVLAELRRLLAAHAMIAPDPARVRFVGFGAHSLDLEVFAYALTADWAEFLGIREDVFLRMMDIVERSGTGFAFPSQTLYLGRDGGLDAERTRTAEAEVEGWRADQRLPFPDFSEEMVASVEDSVPWPPEGSPPRPPAPA